MLVASSPARRARRGSDAMPSGARGCRRGDRGDASVELASYLARVANCPRMRRRCVEVAARIVGANRAPGSSPLRAPPGGHIESTRKIAVIGNHSPRQCGIATFTTDLSRAIADSSSDVDCFVLAMNDAGRRYDYPRRVRFEIAENDVASYRRAADFLNVNEVDVACVQHEYGIFGGKAGSHLLTLLRELRMPIVSTLHTILAEPNAQQRAAMEELLRLSERVVVMSQYG